MTQMNLSMKQKQNSREEKLVVSKREGIGGGMKWKIGVSRYKFLHTEWTSNKVLVQSTGSYI